MPTPATSPGLLRDIATAEKVALFLEYRQFEAARQRIGNPEFSGPLRDEHNRASEIRSSRDPYLCALDGLLRQMQDAFRSPKSSQAGAIRSYCATLRRLIPEGSPDKSTGQSTTAAVATGGRPKGSFKHPRASELVEKFAREHEETGISQAEFCSRERVPTSTFSGYKSAYRSGNRSENPPP